MNRSTDYMTQEADLKVLLKQKKISLLADSIASFSGYSDNVNYNTALAGNNAFYPDNSPLKNVDETYWMRLIRRFDMRLAVNNAAGGAAVTGGLYDISPAYRRAEHLWCDAAGPEAVNAYGTKPDIVVIHLGTNDVMQRGTVGSVSDIDLSNYIPDGSGRFAYDSSVSSMADAYAYTIAKINFLYDTPRIFCMTVLPQGRNREYVSKVNNVIRQIAGLFDNVTVVNLEDITPWTDGTAVLYTQGDCVHPNAEGMAYIEEALRMALAEAYLGEKSDVSYKIFHDNYDYYWLKHTFDRGITERARYLLVGHSLARFGINDRDIPGLINLAFLSQDYYCSYKIIEKAIESIPALEHVVIGTAYYSSYMDLSAARNVRERERTVRVYGRYFDDIHNMDRSIYTVLKDGVFFYKDAEGRTDLTENDAGHMYEECHGDYFFGDYSRGNVSGMCWGSLPEAERVDAAEKRAHYHNKLPEHKEAYEENCAILQRIAELCHKSGIKLTMAVFPANHFYRRYLDPKLREDYQGQIDRIPAEYRPLQWDLFDSAEFDSVGDFIDTDHLNDRGAAKMTEMVKEYLENVRSFDKETGMNMF